ncbi:MAG TPA: helix-turn-helix transcriptional regulator [Patescibacteria group bacterium]|nr:helix-turn-helix transcriptional regulator [Patescibacteria group bacterium]
MPGKRRPRIAVEAQRRTLERLARLGGEVREMRTRRSWTQAELGVRAGLGRMIVNRVERGVGPIDLDGVERIASALGVPLNLGFGRDPRVDVADAGHLAMQELVLRMGRRHGYGTEFELATRPAEPWRSIDVVLASEVRRLVICVECWNTIGDVGAAARVSTRKAAELEAMAVGQWGESARVSLVWVVRATARNRALVARYPAVFASRFPGSSRGWVAALTEGAEPPRDPGLVWCDVDATRIFGWRR